METIATTPQTLPTRRRFLRRVLRFAAGGALACGSTAAYGLWEASRIQVRSLTVAVPHLPQPFVGKTIAVLADFHHGPYVSIPFIRQAVQLTNVLAPDVVALVGDFAHKGTHTMEQLPPCLEALEQLRAPLGVYAVPGNHDMQQAGRVYRDCIGATSLCDLTNRSVRVTSAGAHLWLAGVDDLWYGRPNLDTALHGVPDGAAVVLLSHNPDFAEEHPDDRVGLVLSGHTHGGQAVMPLLGSMWLPSRYGDKYRCGLVQGPASQVYVSCGIGTAGLPFRFNCPPEINLIRLRAPA
jgi:predicted MPP superfamily phosphohydrolase